MPGSVFVVSRHVVLVSGKRMILDLNMIYAMSRTPPDLAHSYAYKMVDT